MLKLFMSNDIAKILIKKIKGEDVVVEDWIEYIQDRPFNDKRYFITNKKIKLLGWKQTVGFESGLKALIFPN